MDFIAWFFFVVVLPLAALFGLVMMPLWMSAAKRSCAPPPLSRGCFDSEQDYLRYMRDYSRSFK